MMPGKRKSIRLAGYDYTSAGAYFVTVCTKSRACILSKIENRVGAELASALPIETSANKPEMNIHLTKLGKIVEHSWLQLAKRYDHVITDEYVVMPNHFHGIVILRPDSCISADSTRAEASSAPTIGRVVQSFKSICTLDYLRFIRKYHLDETARFWQRNYYEHIIRNEKELAEIREYIRNNAATWETDNENPVRW